MAVVITSIVGIIILVWQYIAIKKLKNWYLALVLPFILICIVVGVSVHDNEKIDTSVILGILLISYGPYASLDGLR